MGTVKITNWMRESIVNDMLNHRFKGVYAGLVKQGIALADDVYKEFYDEATRRQMSRLPEGWLPEDDDLGVQFGTSGSSYIALDFSGSWINHSSTSAGDLRPPNFVWKKDNRRLLSKDKGKCVRKYEKDHPFSARYFAIMKEIGEQVELYSKARKMAKQGVAQATTLKRLREVWPECWPFAKRFEDNDARPGLPVPQIASLNEMFKLPVEGRVAHVGGDD